MRSVLVSLIIQKALVVDLQESSQADGLGKVMNLVGVDVGYIQEFSAYLTYLVHPLIEMTIYMILLFKILGSATTGGLVVMVTFIYVGLRLNVKQQEIQEVILKKKDARINKISELLHVRRAVGCFV